MICNNVYLYCNEDISLIENYDKAINDNTQTYICHHKLEIELKLSSRELIKLDKYFNRPAKELIFLTRKEHNSLHFKGENHYRYKKHLDDDTKQKISQSLTGRKLSEETIQKMHHLQTEETKQKISQTLTGKKHNEVTKQKISQTLTGKKHNEVTKQKISQSLTGRKLSEETIQKMHHLQTEETKQKISQSCKGKKRSEETREKLKNRKISEETREKLRLAALKQWEKYHKKINEKN